MYLIFISKILSIPRQKSINNSFNLPIIHISLFMFNLCTVNKITHTENENFDYGKFMAREKTSKFLSLS